jgi:hypothetical protein
MLLMIMKIMMMMAVVPYLQRALGHRSLPWDHHLKIQGEHVDKE